MMKKLLFILPVLALSLDTFSATQYDACYNLSCPQGYKMQRKTSKSGKKLLGSAAGIRECVNSKGKSQAVVKEIDYNNCSHNPCGSLPECKAYAAGQSSCPANAELAAVKAIIASGAVHKAVETGTAQSVKLALPKQASKSAKATEVNLVLQTKDSAAKVSKASPSAKLVLPKKSKKK